MSSTQPELNRSSLNRVAANTMKDIRELIIHVYVYMCIYMHIKIWTHTYHTLWDINIWDILSWKHPRDNRAPFHSNELFIINVASWIKKTKWAISYLYIHKCISTSCSVCILLPVCMFLELNSWYWITNWCALSWGRLFLLLSAFLSCL